MKKLKFYALGLIVAGLLFSTGCKKDSEEDDGGGNNPPVITDYRIVEILGFEDGVEDSKAEITYDGERITQVLEYYTFSKDQWNLDSKVDITYPDNNSFEMIYSDYEEGDWELSTKDEVTLENGLWSEYMEYYYSGVDWISAYRTDYTYTSGKIVKEESFDFYSGQQENESQSLYSWVGDLPSTVEHYHWAFDSWEADTRDTITFANGKIAKVETYSYSMMDDLLRMEYQYAGEVLSSVVYYYNFNGTWTNGGSIDYTYDEHGNMVEEEYSGQWNSRTAYTFEEGKGNIDLFMENTGWYTLPGIGKSADKSNSVFKNLKKIKSKILSK
jgi:hypothetical protein